MSHLFAVHIADNYLALPWLAGGFAGMVVLVGVALYGLREEQLPRLALLTACFFIASLIHPPLFTANLRVHLLLTGVMGILLGRTAPLAITLGLLLQALLFAHGGLTTLGVNTCVMALPACAAGLAFQGLARTPFFAKPSYRWAVAGGLGAAAVLLSVTLFFVVLRWGSIEPQDLAFVAWFAFVLHLPLAVLEGVITAFLVDFLYRVRPAMLGLPPTLPRP